MQNDRFRVVAVNHEKVFLQVIGCGLAKVKCIKAEWYIVLEEVFSASNKADIPRGLLDPPLLFLILFTFVSAICMGSHSQPHPLQYAKTIMITIDQLQMVSFSSSLSSGSSQCARLGAGTGTGTNDPFLFNQDPLRNLTRVERGWANHSLPCQSGQACLGRTRVHSCTPWGKASPDPNSFQYYLMYPSAKVESPLHNVRAACQLMENALVLKETCNTWGRASQVQLKSEYTPNLIWVDIIPTSNPLTTKPTFNKVESERVPF